MKVLKILSWSFGVLSTLILGGVGIRHYLELPALQEIPKELFVNKSMLDTALETVKTLLPMSSGYLLFTAPILKYLKEKKLLWDNSIFMGLILTFGFGILAIGLWSGVFAFLVNVSGAIDSNFDDYSYYNFNWNRALRFSSFAHLSFFISVAWFISTALLTLNEERPKKIQSDS